ncbi:DUF2946 domain-containing protein [Halopseudomonas litoralis]|nr:DUF2946 domain-containing protein [Halopseudomonas litoralis]
MTLVRRRALLAWMLFACILFSALHCASGHGQMVAVQLGAINAEHGHHHHAEHAEATEAHDHTSADSSCDFASPFSAIILAAFFGLLGLLAMDALRPLPVWHVPRQPRSRWPPANPRASPLLLTVC